MTIKAKRSIIFTVESIPAILDDWKTMTRRVIKPPFQIHANGYITHPKDGARFHPYVCPYGAPGDLLYLKETLYSKYKSSITPSQCGNYAFYKADNEQVLIGGPGINDGVIWKWKRPVLSSRFMPRYASRITLEIIYISMERLQDILFCDVSKEGIKTDITDTISRFPDYWNSINGKKHPWSANEWVWVIEFKRVKE